MRLKHLLRPVFSAINFLFVAVVFFAVALLLTPVSALAGGEDIGVPDGGGFVAGFEDLPLMPGLKNVAGSDIVFDTPAGRIIEAEASGQVAREGILDFYARTLPQLGWEHFLEGEYRREGETLKLEIGGEKSPQGPVSVHFFLAPR
ncbi:MAG: hypothetical protein HOI33_00050 [Rhodospirillaceae bacterium]|nr:hypothetical protein [Rhodospirillaceae bacterium]MBT5751082.1 hypothetical protein [Rhodospirillaceae bacterium]